MPRKPAKSKKAGGVPVKSKSACKSYLDAAIFAIRALKSPHGSSRSAIAKFLKQEFGFDNKVAIRKAFKKGEAKGLLERNKQSFLVVGDDRYAPAPELVVEKVDEKIGGGDATVVSGSTVTVAYRGTLAETGEKFDSARSFSFVVGAGDVIKGWDIGLLGMRVGGKRRLLVPSALGYGKRGSGPRGQEGSIPPNSDLRFLITLKNIE